MKIIALLLLTMASLVACEGTVRTNKQINHSVVGGMAMYEIPFEVEIRSCDPAHWTNVWIKYEITESESGKDVTERRLVNVPMNSRNGNPMKFTDAVYLKPSITLKDVKLLSFTVK
jgi:hypothetical protein